MNNNKIKLSAIAALLLTAINANADQVILDDLIVDGSSCIGMDCVNGESFGFDTLRLKENNLRIRAVDTSSTSSFPSRDWQITFNDSSNGGANKFSIDDIDGGRTPFTIEAGAPHNSLYVDDGGRLGLGTSAPVVDVHVRSGNTPTLRLEQDGTSGFTPQTWDVAGNEAGFFVRDATNGSTLPFRIRPGAPSSSIDIADGGNIGIGTGSPEAKLDVVGKAGVNNVFTSTSPTNTHNVNIFDTTSAAYVAQLEFQKQGVTQWFLSSRNEVTSTSGLQNRFSFYNSNILEVMTLQQDGKVGFGVAENDSDKDIQHSNGAHLTTGGVWTNASSRILKDNISDIETDLAFATLEALNPVTYSYKSEPNETYAGFIAEDVPEMVATNDRKGLASMDIVAVLTKVVQEQNDVIRELNSRVLQLEEKESN